MRARVSALAEAWCAGSGTLAPEGDMQGLTGSGARARAHTCVLTLPDHVPCTSSTVRFRCGHFERCCDCLTSATIRAWHTCQGLMPIAVLVQFNTAPMHAP